MAGLSPFLPGGAAANVTVTRDINTSLGGGRTYGAIVNGQVVTKGTSLQALLERALTENIYPTYTPATNSLSMSAPGNGEVGESLSNALTAVFAANDAGPLVSQQISRNGVAVGAAGTVSPYTVSETIARSLAGVTYQASASYQAGPAKPVPPGNAPDTRPAAIRTANAPQAAETGFGSNTVALLGFYRLWFGPGGPPAARANAVALGASQLTSDGTNGTLNTGTTANRFTILLPPGKTLVSVTDIDNLNANLTSSYVAQPAVSIADAGGNLVAGYTPYTLTAATPYTASARHQFVTS